ncbi:YqeG family HAD IIIA-type phosphatase [Vallitalea guaymasensis]|uniref:YqeG family HAD IIIA-type phosphatase n=1 Tax=Vallitalea guaymasensis TaxID=1185412 RepID=A0A8J8MDN9_9FIRM|nr:YqeG family HAD IIIA-type phosphatase [Vallitalea guaymasensis]QUH31036.1 YqeG family HAD IIIA-type phosphatase [Vallitalea guaymasensis]
MLERFFPSEYTDSIRQINYRKLYDEGYRGILFDIDNTLVPYDMEHPNQEIIDLFEDIKKIGFKIALVSNNNKIRVTTFNEKLKVFAVHKALKPMTRNLKRAMQAIKTNKKNTVLVGDQIFTDIYGGNRIKIKTILVVPIAEKEEWITKIKRNTEKKIIKAYLKRVKKNESKH